MGKFRIPRHKHSLTLRIVAWSALPTAVVLLAVALVTFGAHLHVISDLVIGRNQQLTRLSAGQLASGLTNFTDTLSTLARTGAVYQGDPARQSAALREAANRLVEFDGGVLVLNDLGRVAAADAERASLVGQDWSSRDFFRRMIHSSGPVFSDILPGNPEVIAIAVPLLNEQGEFRGTMVGMFRLGATTVSAFYGGIVKLRLGGGTYLVDSTGRVIYHPDAARIGIDMHDEPVVQQVLQGRSGFLQTRGLDHRDILATYAPVPGTPWGLITEEDWARLLASAGSYKQFLLLLLVMGVIAPTLVIVFGVKRITHPMAKLIGAAKEIAGGKFGDQITIRTGDELEDLVKQFNVMSSKLEESYTQLEQRVAARTQELATLNAVSETASRSLDLQAVLSDTLDKILQVMRMDFGGAYCLKAVDGHSLLAPVVFRGLSDELAGKANNPAYLGSIFKDAIEVASMGAPAVLDLASEPEPGEDQLRQMLESEGVCLAVSVPLTAKGKLVGVLYLGTRESRTIAPEELSLLAAVGQGIGVAVENASLYDRAEQSAALAERTRLARELHDSVTQSLYSVTLYAEAAAILLDGGDSAAAAEHLRALRDTAQEALREMRLLIYELRPPALEKSGLVTALQARLDAVESRGGLKAELYAEGDERLPVAVQQELYHLALEALNNVIKHAHAQHVWVRLLFSDDPLRARLEIRDDGASFDLAAALASGGLGLAGMRERAQRIGAELDITTSPGHGTQVTVDVPGDRIKQG